MIVLDGTVLSVALPTITSDLHLSGGSLIWLVNSYMLAFGGFLLAGGRLGDVYGRRRLFLIGIGVFALASLICGLANTPSVLFSGRALQGLAGAVLTGGALSLTVCLFADSRERAKAMAILGFVYAAGGSVGTLVGGLVTQLLNWHWIFLINLPLGIGIFAYCVALLPSDEIRREARSVGFFGSAVVTLALTLAVYGLTHAQEAGWSSTLTRQLLWSSLALVTLFLLIEARTENPLLPIRLFRNRNFAVASLMGILWSAEGYAWFIVLPLYLQGVLGYDPIQVACALLPFTILSATLSVAVSAKVVGRFGIRGPTVAGLILITVGLALLAYAPVHSAFITHLLPAMILMGIGASVAQTALLLAAMSNIQESESGIASGVINTSFILGGTVGMTLLMGFATARTLELQRLGMQMLEALNAGYQLVFLGGALLTALAGALGGWMLREAHADSAGSVSEPT